MKTQTIMSFLAVALTSGCATTNKQLVTNEQLMQEIRGFREENLALRAELEAQKQQPQRVEQSAAEEFQQFPQAAVVAQQVKVVPPPAQPEPNGPPQNWGWMYTPPRGCESGPFRLRILNWQTNFFARVFIDGKEIDTRGANGLLAFPAPDGSMMTAIPPGPGNGYASTVNICLGHLGEHTISGVLYAGRMGELQEAGTFEVNQTFGGDAPGMGHVFAITDSVISWKR